MKRLPDDPGIGDDDETAHSRARMLAFALCAMAGSFAAALVGLATWWLR